MGLGSQGQAQVLSGSLTSGLVWVGPTRAKLWEPIWEDQ